MIHFERLQTKHYTLIHDWFNKPHVQAFYSLREWTLDEVEKKLAPYLHGDVKGHIIVLDKPVGYIQSYPIKSYPWENQGLDEDVIQKGAGIDFFIGEENYMGRGIGKDIVNAFLDQVLWQEFDYCVVDPDEKNTRSINCFKSCGFKIHKEIESENALKEKVKLKLLIKKKV